MGFLDFLGGVAGNLAAQAQETYRYKGEYESMSDHDLIREYKNLKNKSGDESKYRRVAVSAVLKDRGITEINFQRSRNMIR